MNIEIKKGRKKLLLASGLLMLVLAFYGFLNREFLPYYLGYGDPSLVGSYVVRMKAGWYPYATNSELQTISFAKGRAFSLLQYGHIDFHFFKELDPDFLTKVKNNSELYKKYEWGTVLLLKDSFYTEVLKIKPETGPDAAYFVPEFNLKIDVLQAGDIDKIQIITRAK